MLFIKIRCWKNHIYNLLDKNNEDIYSGFLDFVKDTVECYEKQRIEDGIPQIVIDKFNEWHKPHIDVLIGGVEAICNGRSFSSKSDIMNAILYVNLSTLVLTVTTAEKTLSKLNGELSGITYKGKILL